MITLGIDPGIERIGVGFVESKNGKIKLLSHELIKTPSTLTTAQRLALLYEKLTHILNNHKADNVAVEELFFARNTTTAITVAHARGVIMLALQNAGLPIYEYTPLQVKQSLLGYGRADKKQIQYMIKMMLGESAPKQDDVADAVAIAITHINMSRLNEKLKIFS
ncbi:MAG: crossover junction endodeoxyribonuclease RuvC [Spirochaetales bacterium]|nr:crossover junction endodeoxyribonuclease RuvC [Spirochaetales bacterium]